MAKLVKLTSTWNSVQDSCWIDPDGVTGVFATGVPACSRIDRGNAPSVLVLGTPEDVYAALFPATEEGAE